MMPSNELEDISREAVDIVTRGRGVDYGEPEDCFEAIAQLWDAYLRTRYQEFGIELDAVDVARMMQLLKLARRIVAPKPQRDSFVDAIGYILCEARCEPAEVDDGQ